MNNSIPDRLSIEKNKEKIYKKLKKEVKMFKDISNKDLFFLTLIYGYNNGEMKEIDSKKGFVRTEYLNEKDLTLLRAIALEKKNIDVLTEPKEIFKLAEEYANFGLEIIVDRINSTAFGNFDKELENEFFDLYKENFST